MRSFLIALSIVILMDNVQGFSNILPEKKNNSVNLLKTTTDGSFFGLNFLSLSHLSSTMVDPHKLENILRIVDELIRDATTQHDDHQASHQEALDEFNAASTALQAAIEALTGATNRKNTAQTRYDDAVKDKNDRYENLMYQLQTLKNVHGQLHTLHPNYTPPSSSDGSELEEQVQDLYPNMLQLNTLQTKYVINALSMFQMVRQKVDPNKLENVMGGVADLINDVENEINGLTTAVDTTKAELEDATQEEQKWIQEKQQATTRKQNAQAVLNTKEQVMETHKTQELEMLKNIRHQLGSLEEE